MSHFHDERPFRAAQGHWVSQVSPHWSIGANPNGGYLQPWRSRHLARIFPSPIPVSIAAHYLRPGEGAAPATVSRYLRPESTATGRCGRARGQNAPGCSTYGTLPTDAPGPSDRQPKAPTLPAPELCMDRGSAPQGVTAPIAERLDVR